jgi:DNA-binding SARP family transcriptional activator
VQFSILGTLAVRDDSGEEIAVRGVLQRRLLGLLVCNAGRVTSTELLIGALWNGSPPPSAGKTLQSHIVRLRSAIDPARRLLETRPSGYVLQVGREAVDALRFERLVMLAGHASAAGVPDSAAAMLADALALWRGTAAYADLRDCDVLDREGARLDAVRQSALEDRVEADLACGRGPELVPELEMSAQHHPFRERLWRLLAVALYRSGRQVDALAAL